jgi:hypothetical protein
MEVPMKLTQEQAHVTVLLSSKFSTVYKPFHCVSCGNIVFSYNEDEVRSIIPSGHPQLDRAGKMYQCHGVMKLRSTSSIYDILYQVMEMAMKIDDITELRTAIAYTARDGDDEQNARCKMVYFVS